ncbi:MAG: V-type ATP synthase subunit A [Promethearchaeota archaeon]
MFNQTDSKNKTNRAYISAIIGSLIKVKGLENQTRLHDLIKIIKYNILGEVIQIYSDHVTVQCFEDTTNVKLYDNVISLNEPLSMELAPGLLSNVFDGLQRPLGRLFEDILSGRLERGIQYPSISRTKKWHFIPLRKLNDKVEIGDIIGVVQETSYLEHRIMVPPYTSGILSFIANEGNYTIIDEIFRIKVNDEEKSFAMLQKWPITKRRPYDKKFNPIEPLITGIRTIDLLFPIAKGGTTAIPGGFGTGKTVIQQMLAKWCNADLIVYIGCGEPGNEIANIMKEFSDIIDPKNGRTLSDRIILIANTSNMPVSAREASLFSGVTIAEYYRDMGYDVVVLADSISRWAESLREISGLLEEMPAEEGYPAYLPSKLSSFYERAGYIKTLGNDQKGNEKFGSLTIIGTISPPAGDFSEPVTSTTKRLVQTFWALDSKLAYLKQYPAINWQNSYSNYPQFIAEWWYNRDIEWPEIDIEWLECRKLVNEILSQEKDLEHVIQLAGDKNLLEDQKLTLFIAKMIKNGFLIQNAYDQIDNHTSMTKLLGLIKIILILYREGKSLINKGKLFDEIFDPDLTSSILRIHQMVPNDEFQQLEEIKNNLIQIMRVKSI